MVSKVVNKKVIRKIIMVKVTDKELSQLGMHVELGNDDIDLVCGMDVSQKSKYNMDYKDNRYYFCSDHCKIHFRNNPEKYIGE